MSTLSLVPALIGVFLAEAGPGLAAPATSQARQRSAAGARTSRKPATAKDLSGQNETRDWYRGALAWNASPVNLRFLNRDDLPAGRHGFLKTSGDRLVFQDGTPARFWGANLAAYALFSTPRQNVAPQARRMAQLGYNLMRIHHHDSKWVAPNIFRANSLDSTALSPQSLDALDWWIKCLEDEGIYIWLDMNVGRTIRPGDRIAIGRDEIERNGEQFHGFDYYNQDLQRLMIEFQRAYLGHVNRYTQKAYKDDPALIGVLVTNEDDFTQHFGLMMLPDKHNPAHNVLFTRGYKEFARRHALPEGRVFQIWGPGPGKLYTNEVEHEFNATMIADLRNLGVKVPIATTNYFGDNWISSLPALADGDVIDTHSYGKNDSLSTDPRKAANFVHSIASGAVHGKPLTISEWSVEYPTADRFTGPLYLASIAALQGWHAPMLYNYAQTEIRPQGSVGKWDTYFDPALCGVMPVAALAYRQGHISPARSAYCLALDAAGVFDRGVNALSSPTIRTLVEQSRLTIALPAVKELPWVKPSQPADVTVVADFDRDFIPAGQSVVRSDTGELSRDWELGIHTIDTPLTQAVSGGIGGKTLKTRHATFQFHTPKAVVALSSIDKEPIASSRFILITAVARAVATPGERTPMLSEPVTGTIGLQTTVEDLELLSLGPDGRVVGRATPARADGVLTVPIPGPRGTHWFVLKPVEQAR
jgi:hypothetical protein